MIILQNYQAINLHNINNQDEIDKEHSDLFITNVRTDPKCITA